MTFTLLRRFVTQVVVVFVALAAILTSGAPAQSLGDVARKEEARRKATANGKVYTNDDCARRTSAGHDARRSRQRRPRAAGGAPADAAKPDAKSEAKPATGGDARAGASADPKAGAPDGKSDEAAWRERRKSIQDALARAESFAEALQSRINGLSDGFRRARRPGTAGHGRRRSAEGARRAGAREEGNPAAHQGAGRHPGRGPPRGVPAGWLR